MNRRQLQKLIGQSLRLRPVPQAAMETQVDDLWTVIVADETGLHLRNQRTGDEFPLGKDHIMEYRTPNFLILKSTVSLLPKGPALEPIIAPPKVTLEVKPFPEPVQNSDGTWMQEIHVCGSKPD
ncbi:MAG: hypothetical protein Q8R28_21395, partial [Dehalococcoidia bacterium]|nr:hypothetical protein [Dehalococcoidia bacterium]